MTTRLVRTAIAAALLACVACSSGGGDMAGSTSTSTESPSTTGSLGTTLSTPTTAGEAECPPPPMSTAAADVATTPGDFDADGTADVASSYRVGDGEAAEWRIRVDLATGTSADSVVPRDLGGASGIGATAVIGAVDVNGDGRAELWAKVGEGAGADLMALFVIDGCAVKPVIADGVAVVFSVGGASPSFAGVECNDIDGNGALDFVVKLEARSTDGGATFQTTETEYVLVDGMFGVLSQVPGNTSPADPGFSRFKSFSCGGLTEG